MCYPHLLWDCCIICSLSDHSLHKVMGNAQEHRMRWQGTAGRPCFASARKFHQPRKRAQPASCATELNARSAQLVWACLATPSILCGRPIHLAVQRSTASASREKQDTNAPWSVIPQPRHTLMFSVVSSSAPAPTTRKYALHALYRHPQVQLAGLEGGAAQGRRLFRFDMDGV